MKLFRSLAITWALLLASTSLFAQSTKIAPDLLGLLTNPQPVTVIVQLSNAPSILDIGALQGLGGLVKQVFSSVPALKVTLPGTLVGLVAALPDVVYISPDRV